MLLSKKEIATLRSQAEWQDDKNIYKIPHFYIKEK